MRQLAFRWVETRFEQAGAYWSFVEGGVVERGYVGPHSIDLAWPWWKSWRLV